ncbi:MAG: hypothetical protein ACXWN0_15445, partial [Isosphaeraceae bacterium]
GVELVKLGTKVSKAGRPVPPGNATFPTCVTVIGIDVGLAVFETPWVVNVALSPENAAETKSLGELWPKIRMVPALAEVGRPSKAAHPKTRVHDKSRAKTGTRFVADFLIPFLLSSRC